MKIMFFIPSLEGGGAERVALNLARVAVSNKVEIFVVVAKAGGKLLQDMSKIATVIDLKKSRVNQCIRPLAKAIDVVEPDAVISFMDHCNIVLLLSKLFTNYKNFKTIISVHNNLEVNLIKTSRWKGELIKFLVSKLYNRADSIVCVSQGVQFSLSKFLKKKTMKKTCVIYNPSLDESIMSKAGEDIKLPFVLGEHKLICAVGRLTKQKGFDLLISAYAALKNRSLDSRLIILGEGEERENLVKLIAKLNLKNEIFLLGFQDNPYKYIAKSDLFVFSSRWEGFGVALVEALYLKTSVVSFDCDYGPREILANGLYGALVPNEDVESLSIAIAKCLKEDKKIETGDYLRKFTLNHVFSEYKKLWT